MELLCPHCNQQVEAEVGDEFCPECGQPIGAALAGAPALGSDPVGSAPIASSGDPATSGSDPALPSSDPAASATDPAASGSAPAAAVATQTSAPAGSLQIKVDGRPPVPYTGAPILVGRLDEASGAIPDVPFNDPAISRRHLTIWLEGGRIFAQDGSTNGTFRGGLRLPQGSPIELFTGETLTLPGQMGTYSVHVELS